MSLGFELAGGQPLWAIEQDKWAALTYRANNPSVTLVERDICEFSDDEVKELRALKPKLIIGGPPC